LGCKAHTGRTFDLTAARRQDFERVAAGTEMLRQFERRRRTGCVQQLESWMDDDAYGPAHGSFCPIYVISDKA
jgi:hypothetical protein